MLRGIVADAGKIVANVSVQTIIDRPVGHQKNALHPVDVAKGRPCSPRRRAPDVFPVFTPNSKRTVGNVDDGDALFRCALHPPVIRYAFPHSTTLPQGGFEEPAAFPICGRLRARFHDSCGSTRRSRFS
ncbi:hypothetical protein [Burkholderia lata]|uniref:hypothetical protein n=1 Tax=Burkholderia lata (strain ATCC 17760 / DSM 23089 / LMG 22485 / NCIMB 9086 / R18194 / 383) TaxID=482957 RepID=UPI001583D610|nr:hypothetical protein [Burkholderia lata]